MLQSTPPAGPPAGLLPTLAFANFAIGIGAFGVIGVITPISSGLGLTHSQAGMVMSIYALAYAIGSPLAITATGRLDRRSVILTGMGLFFVASLLCALAPNAEALLAGRALAALGAGMVLYFKPAEKPHAPAMPKVAAQAAPAVVPASADHPA
jgi:predicted MFS family arabinose efflux permease